MSWQKVGENIAEFVLIARAVSGYFDKTLKSIVRQKVDRYFRSNCPLRKHRYPAIRRAMGSVGTHPYVSIGAIAALYAIVSVWTWYAPLPGPTAPDNIHDYFRDFQSINMAVLGVQGKRRLDPIDDRAPASGVARQRPDDYGQTELISSPVLQVG